MIFAKRQLATSLDLTFGAIEEGIILKIVAGLSLAPVEKDWNLEHAASATTHARVRVNALFFPLFYYNAHSKINERPQTEVFLGKASRRL